MNVISLIVKSCSLFELELKDEDRGAVFFVF
jgi:hypothetical protein